jgi:hypothetical protein
VPETRGRQDAGRQGARAVQLDVADDAPVRVAVKSIKADSGLRL